MSRQIEKGLSYIPVELNIFQDRKIRRLRRKCDVYAPFVYVAIICTIYKEGYYIRYDDDFLFDIADMIGLDEAYVSSVIDACLSVDLLSKEMFVRHKILTSAGIQKQYQKICELCKRVSRVEEYSLIQSSEEWDEKDRNQCDSSEEWGGMDDADAHSSEESNENTGNPAHSSESISQSKVKESKVKENKEKNSFFPSSPSVESEEEKEKERIVSYFTFKRNYVAPNYEYERMVAFNTNPSYKKKWSEYSSSEKESCMSMWHPEGEGVKSHKDRFPPGFVPIWKKVYDSLVSMDAPYDIRMELLSDSVSVTSRGAELHLKIPDHLREYLEQNLDMFKPIIWPYVQQTGCWKLIYQPVR